MSYENFEIAFHHAMKWEVSPSWNPSDPDVIDGLCDTRAKRKKVGYVNDPNDSGGLTKYGIAQNKNPNVDVALLNLDEAMSIYYDLYWLTGRCDVLPFEVAIIHFDGCVNVGVMRAAKMLQIAAEMENVDGIIGRMTTASVWSFSTAEIIKRIAEERRNYYESIVRRKPSQQVYLRGWFNRINDVEKYSLSLI